MIAALVAPVLVIVMPAGWFVSEKVRVLAGRSRSEAVTMMVRLEPSITVKLLVATRLVPERMGTGGRLDSATWMAKSRLVVRLLFTRAWGLLSVTLNVIP